MSSTTPPLSQTVTTTPFAGSSGGIMRALTALSVADRNLVEQARADGRLTDTQVLAAVHAWRDSSASRSFAGFLAELHYCTERQLSGWLAKAHKLNECRHEDLAGIAPEVGRLLHRTIATARCALPMRKGLGASGGITVAVADPGEPQLSQVGHALAQHGKITYCVAPRKDIQEAIDRIHRPRETQGSNVAGLLADDMAINRYVEELLRRAAIELRASDLHVVPETSTIEIKMRINGDIETVDVIPCDAVLKARLASGFKLASGRGADGITKLPAGVGGALDVTKTLVPQDGNGMREYGSRTFTLRFSSSPCIKGESIVIRFLDLDAQVGTLADLGMLRDHEEIFLRVVKSPDGLIVNSGPTGHGKSTTLAACVEPMRCEGRRMVDTLENPVEYRFPGVRQRQIEPGVPGRDYPDQMRSLLRQNPNAIIVGEMRDSVTAQLCLEFANTGHLVASTLHANTALASIPRLMELGVEAPVIAIAARLFVAQRLVAKLCPRCSRRHPHHEALCSQHAALWDSAQKAEALPRGITEMSFREAGGGCEHCRGRGVMGRVAVYELREVTDFLRRRIAREGANFDLYAAEEDYLGWTEEKNERVRAAKAAYVQAERLGQSPHMLELAAGRLATERAQHTRSLFAARSLLDDGIIKAGLGLAAIEEVMARVSQRVM